MDLEKLEKILQNRPKFRLKQAQRAVFFDFIESWEENSTLPAELKKELEEKFPLLIRADVVGSKKSDSQKALIFFENGNSAETVLLKHKDGRRTVCVSSQVGCPLGCLFCATGKLGFERNLGCGEILQQVLFFARMLKNSTDRRKRITNVVFMGMGEPFLNYENVLKAASVLNDKDHFGIGARHISISTCGIVEGIERFSNEKLQLNLAISLHASNDKLRSKLMPINRKYPLEKLMPAVRSYAEKSLRRVMFEYMMIDGVNDKLENAQELAKLLDCRLFALNLIRYNPTGKFRPSRPETIKKFKDFLLKKGINVTQRYSFGQDISAACGQLAGEKKGPHSSAG